MKKAMILAAGMGTRLGAITLERPKILVDIGGFTLLEWIVGKLGYFGFNDIIINVHHHAGMVEEAAREVEKSQKVRITISDERDELLDTGGGLYKARDFFGKEPFLIYNGDIVTDLDLGKLYNCNIEAGAVATLALRHRPGKRFFIIDQEGILKGWKNSETGEVIESGNITGETTEVAFSAISVVSPSIFKYMSDGVYSMRGVYLEAARNETVNSLIHDGGNWIDIGSPAQLQKCRDLISAHNSFESLFSGQ
ncbi:MAG: nucleotidyltransferase family protein [Bacteroidales bacterium]